MPPTHLLCAWLARKLQHIDFHIVLQLFLLSQVHEWLLY
jgi:hypothetical protein